MTSGGKGGALGCCVCVLVVHVQCLRGIVTCWWLQHASWIAADFGSINALLVGCLFMWDAILNTLSTPAHCIHFGRFSIYPQNPIAFPQTDLMEPWFSGTSLCWRISSQNQPSPPGLCRRIPNLHFASLDGEISRWFGIWEQKEQSPCVINFFLVVSLVWIKIVPNLTTKQR